MIGNRVLSQRIPVRPRRSVSSRGWKQIGGSRGGVCLLGRRAYAREGEAGSPEKIMATVGRGKAKLSPSKDEPIPQ